MPKPYPAGDFIRLVLRQYEMEQRQPRVKPYSKYDLRMATDAGEIDEDLPSESPFEKRSNHRSDRESVGCFDVTSIDSIH